jgi:hypothetical protein
LSVNYREPAAAVARETGVFYVFGQKKWVAGRFLPFFLALASIGPMAYRQGQD